MANPYKEITTIGIVCVDDLRLSPVASVLLRDMVISSSKASVRRIQVSHAGQKRGGTKVADSAKGFLQSRGFGSSDMFEPERVSKAWMRGKDLILTMDRFIRRDLIYDYFPTKTAEWQDKIIVLTDAAGINEKIRDPKDDYNADTKSVFELIERCCKAVFKKIEAAN